MGLSGSHYLSKEDLQAAADYVGCTYSFIHGVATFYSMFSLVPRGKYIIRVCSSPACHLKGATNVINILREKLNVEVGKTTQDGLFTLETASCLGACCAAPALMINDEIYGHLDEKKIDEIIEYKRREK
jgi:NADH-quinone oxidoreductase subunit E